MLKVNNVCTGYEGVQIVNGISIEVKDKQVVSIVGANGVGKSTLIKAIVGQIPAFSGEIWFDNQKISGMRPNETAEIGIVLVPEGRQLFSNMSVEDNMHVGSCTKKNRITRQENLEMVYELFPKLKERRKQLAGTLSGGEQQMVATGRALMANPKLLIMDEPSWGLAPILVNELFETIQAVREKGTAILLIEQNVSKALQQSDWAYVIEHGEVSMQGVGKELLLDENLKKAYLGL